MIRTEFCLIAFGIVALSGCNPIAAPKGGEGKDDVVTPHEVLANEVISLQAQFAEACESIAADPSPENSAIQEKRIAALTQEMAAKSKKFDELGPSSKTIREKLDADLKKIENRLNIAKAKRDANPIAPEHETIAKDMLTAMNKIADAMESLTMNRSPENVVARQSELVALDKLMQAKSQELMKLGLGVNDPIDRKYGPEFKRVEARIAAAQKKLLPNE